MRKTLTALFLCLAFLIGIAQNASAAVSIFDQKTASGSFGENPDICTYKLGSLELEPCRGDTIVGYDSATGVLSYVRQNPWSAFDAHGLNDAIIAEYNNSSSYVPDSNGGSTLEYVKGVGDSVVATASGLYRQSLPGRIHSEIDGTHARQKQQLKQAINDPKGTAIAIKNGVVENAKTPRGQGQLTGALAQAIVAKKVSGKLTGKTAKDTNLNPECFVAGTPIACPEGAIPIEEIRVGQRVWTSPEEDQVSETVINPDTWRVFKLSLVNPVCDDDIYQIDLLRPQSWLTSNKRNQKGQVWVEFEELSAYGWADIVAVSSCPEIEPGQGRVVLMTINHDNTFLYHLTNYKNGPPLGVTGYHPLYSETRNQWVQVYDLKQGEILRTQSGTTQIVEKKRIPGRYKVYNLEVEADHRYYAGEEKVLSHNNGCGKNTARGGALTEPTLPNETIASGNGVEIKQWYSGNDHAPAHAHVYGEGLSTKIGANGKVIKGEPGLSVNQRKVVKKNKKVIRRDINKIRKWLNFQRVKKKEGKKQ